MSKKLLSLLLCCLCALAAAEEETFTEGDWLVQVLEGPTAGIVAYLGEGGEVTVPESLQELPVTAIGEGAFEGTAVTSLVIPEGVLGALDRAFANCASLTAVSLPESFAILGASAFEGCVSLERIRVPDAVSEL